MPAFAAIASLVLWGVFVFVQTVRHRDYFLPPVGADDETTHAAPPSLRTAWASFALLLVSLVAVIGLAKVLSPTVERALDAAGALPRLRRWDDGAVRFALSAFWAREGRAPERTDVSDPRWVGPSLQTFRRRYGGLEAAWATLGPVPTSSSATTRSPTRSTPRPWGSTTSAACVSRRIAHDRAARSG